MFESSFSLLIVCLLDERLGAAPFLGMASDHNRSCVHLSTFFTFSVSMDKKHLSL
jgi:hypothetical protein